AVAAAALTAFVGTASATTVTSPTGTAFSGTIKATSTNSALDGPFTTVACSHSLFEGKIEVNGAKDSKGNTLPASGTVTNLTFTGCNYEVKVIKTGTLSVNTANEVTSNGAEITVLTSVGDCIFTTNSTKVGTVTDSPNDASSASMDINSASIPRTGGNFLCGSFGTWTGNYTVSSPVPLVVD
ncbi:MAG TPA: hypothetical protein VN732_07290, partial [Solirubrobacterales bacterium]|nr:hypothetical protein [Solirubrobacterales bacterium]